MKNISLRVPVMLLCALVAPWGSVAAATDCGIATTLKGKDGVALPARKFSDGSIAVRAPLAVNPDGGAASYTVGDHGFTYIANGLARWRAGKREGCDAACSAAFKAAEAAGFKDGTDEFCVFAMEVGPIEPGRVTVPCAGGTVVGNGKGRPLPGERLKSIAGVQVQAYRSTTSLQHLVDGKPRHLDAEALPLAVSPGAELLGRVLWVGGAGMHASHALVGDAGPAFGEGSIALHQLLRAGAVTPQKPGPIPVASRCSAAETSLREPFQSRPNGGAGDRCKPGFTAKTDSDVRAYVAIDKKLDFVVLGAAASFAHKGSVIQSEVTPAAIADKAASAGYTAAKIAEMLACLGS